MGDIVDRLRSHAEQYVGDMDTDTDVALLAAADEIERLHTWDGLMSLLDEHWPEDLFPTLEDNEHRDPGVRIVSLIRWVDHLRGQ